MGRSESKQKDSQKAIVSTKTASAKTEGLEDFFKVSDEDDTTADSLVLSVKGACKRLGIRKKLLYFRISEGVYKTFAGRNGELRVVLPIAAKEDVHPSLLVQRPKNSSVEETAIVQETTVIDEPKPLTSDPELAQVIEKLFNQMSAASVRIGYLESQLEQQSEHAKLLPDLRSHISQSLAIKQENDQLRTRLGELQIELEQARRSTWTKTKEWLTPHIKWWFGISEPGATV